MTQCFLVLIIYLEMKFRFTVVCRVIYLNSHFQNTALYKMDAANIYRGILSYCWSQLSVDCYIVSS